MASSKLLTSRTRNQKSDPLTSNHAPSPAIFRSSVLYRFLFLYSLSRSREHPRCTVSTPLLGTTSLPCTLFMSVDVHVQFYGLLTLFSPMCLHGFRSLFTLSSQVDLLRPSSGDTISRKLFLIPSLTFPCLALP